MRYGAAQTISGEAFVMGAYGWAALAAVLAITLVPGGAAVLRSWLFPRLRGRVESPRIWGLGVILMGLGLSIELLAAHRHDDLFRNVAGLTGVCILVSGFCLEKWMRVRGRLSRS
ncbi:hypothetical protein ACIP98_01230 [Streptomyces sp. NPDC088354]|uniref:hypothetical protein n=1 Tax=Streptomyces sp. NPDC088354 TaxID=3365856 RepID=UPI0037F76A0D